MIRFAIIYKIFLIELPLCHCGIFRPPRKTVDKRVIRKTVKYKQMYSK